MAVRHRIAVFQVTPLRYTTVAGSNSRMISAFHKSVIGARSFIDTTVTAVAGLQSGVAALNYVKLYDAAEKQPFMTSMSLVDSAGLGSWMEPPTYFVRDNAISTATLSERQGANPGADIDPGHYQQWKTSADVRATG